MEPIRLVSFCPHCGNQAPQYLIHTQKFLGKGYGLDGRLFIDDFPCAYFVAVCETCHEILLYLSEGDDVEDKGFTEAGLIWPDAGRLHQSVPETVRACYQEAARIKHLAPNAFAVQIRRALEALCDDRKAKKGSLQQRLKELASKGEIPPLLTEMTEVLRILGNIGAHSTDQSVQPGYIFAIDEFFRAIIEYVYVAPYKVKEFQKRLEEM